VPSETVFETRGWQTCGRCQGHRWRSALTGDVCVTCAPSGAESLPATWVRAGAGWVCSRCYPPVPTNDRLVCAICGGKGACRPDHDDRLRQFGEQLFRRTRSQKKQEQIRTALVALARGEEER